jgi:hypothetical protein
MEALGGLIISAVFYMNIYHFITTQLNVHCNNIHHSIISRVMTSQAVLMEISPPEEERNNARNM